MTPASPGRPSAAVHATLEVDGEGFEVALAPQPDGSWDATVDGESLRVRVTPGGDGTAIEAGAATFRVEPVRDGEARIDGAAVAYRVATLHRGPGRAGTASGTARVRAPMPGRVERLHVHPGDAVAAGQLLFVLEAMKMHNDVRSPIAGRVKAVHAQAGAAVDPSRTVVEVEPAGP